jgi:hypothetical protein
MGGASVSHTNSHQHSTRPPFLKPACPPAAGKPARQGGQGDYNFGNHQLFN